MQNIYLIFILLLPLSAIAQTCDCCELRSKGQKKFDAKDWVGAKTTWQNAQKMPDAAKCPELSGLIKKAENKIAAQREAAPKQEEEANFNWVFDTLALKRIRSASDHDHDGVNDQEDLCPDDIGTKELHGCPDRDKDGIPDKNDQCPDAAGTAALKGCPDLKDDDEDGTPNYQDECPGIYGAKQYQGCPDRDFDETPDVRDTCPNQPGPKNTNGCPDRDSDGVADKDDQCLDAPGPKALFGCPDRDLDGIADKNDICPDAPGPQRFNGCPDKDSDETPDLRDECPDIFGPKRFNGCPDTDFDETPDQKDQCIETPGPKTAYGCPDRDADGVADKDDKCPDMFTMISKDGCPEEAFIPGGTYTMGDLFGDGKEVQHTVTLTGFLISKKEITFYEFDAFCTSTNRIKPNDRNGLRDKHPVINVDWYDAVEYCNWLSEKAGLTQVYSIDKTHQDDMNKAYFDKKKWTVNTNWAANGYRLPTEAEWEYAAKEGGKKNRFGNGIDIADPAQMNFQPRKGKKEKYSKAGEFRQNTVVVDELVDAANSFGLRHMSGNVEEWCNDWYDANGKGGETNPAGSRSGIGRVVRGGSWLSYPSRCRAASRSYGGPSSSDSYRGFRVVRRL